jgi:hypothetical protein
MMIDNAQGRLVRIDRDGLPHCGKCDATMRATIEVVFQGVPACYNTQRSQFLYADMGEILKHKIVKLTCIACFHAIDTDDLLLSLPGED